MDKKLYDVATIETVGGTYKIVDPQANDYVNVECCNNLEVPQGYSCSADHKMMHVSEDTQCSVFKRCPYENGIEKLIGYLTNLFHFVKANVINNVSEDIDVKIPWA